MADYTMEFARMEHSTYFNVCTIHCKRERFTNREFKNVLLNTLFMFSATDCEYQYMKAVVKRDGVPVLYAKSVTVVDGSQIDAYVRIGKDETKLHPYRVMNVAC